ERGGRSVRLRRPFELRSERAPALFDRRPQRGRYPGERRRRRTLRRAHGFPRSAGARAARFRARPGGWGTRASARVVAPERGVGHMELVPAAIESYCEAHSSAPSPLLAELQAYTTR